MSENKNQVKLCVQCNTVKSLSGGFYKAGNSWQKRCKLCHNAKRCEYIHGGSNYTARPKGFAKLPEDLQKKIQYDIKVRVNFKDIANKYKDEGIKYQTLLNWKRKGIPPYSEPIQV
jgi:hypothetical protein